MLVKIKEILLEYVDDVDGVTEDSRFATDIGLSSMDSLSFLGEIEDEFSLPTIKEEDIPKLVTVGDLMNFIEKNK